MMTVTLINKTNKQTKKTWMGIFQKMGGNSPFWNFPGENSPGWSLIGGNFPGGNFPDIHLYTQILYIS